MNVSLTTSWITFYRYKEKWIVEHRSCPSGENKRPYAVEARRELTDRKVAEATAVMMAAQTGFANVEDQTVVVIDPNEGGTFSVLAIPVLGKTLVLRNSATSTDKATRVALHYAAENKLNIPFIPPIITHRVAPTQK